jgi:predicted amidohydrolase
MRNVKVGAIQPGYLPSPAEYDCMGGNYRPDAREIVEKHIKKQLAVSFTLVEQAGREGCGIVTTCEDAAVIGNYAVDTTEKNIFPELVARTAPLAEEGFSGLARKYSMYVVACYAKKTGDKICNTASLFDRCGNIVGEYRKTHLPAYEKWQVAEGDSLPSFETDFGRIGVCICYDMMFPECVEAVALSGAEIIFHPTAGYGWYDSIGEATLRTRANDNSVYIVTAKNWVHNAAGKSSVIDYWGQLLADAGFHRDVVVAKEIDLDVPKAQPDWFYPTQTSGIAGMRERNLRERRPELYSALVETTHDRLGIPGREEQAKIIEKIKKRECRW